MKTTMSQGVGRPIERGTLQGFIDFGKHPENSPKAKLLSAAPDLLEACKVVLGHLDPPDANGAQCKLYSDALHPTDDDKTIVDYLREVVTRATTQKEGAK